MKVNRGRMADVPSDRRGPTFTGKVWADPLLQGVPGILVNAVFFPRRAYLLAPSRGWAVSAGDTRAWLRADSGRRGGLGRFRRRRFL